MNSNCLLLREKYIYIYIILKHKLFYNSNNNIKIGMANYIYIKFPLLKYKVINNIWNYFY